MANGQGPGKPPTVTPTLFDDLHEEESAWGQALSSEFAGMDKGTQLVRHETPYSAFLQTLGEPSSTSHPVDITDPGIDPGDVQLTPAEEAIRFYRRLGRSFKAAAVTPYGPLAAGAGMARAVQEGELAPPHTRSEEVLDAVMPILSNLALFGGAGLVGGAVRAGLGAAASGAALEAPGAALAAGTAPEAAGAAEAAAGPFAGVGLADLLGVDLVGEGLGPALVAATGAKKLATAGLVSEKALAEAVGATGFDVGLGAGFGAAETSARRKMGEPITGEEMASTVAKFAAYGGLLGTIMRPRTAMNIARSAFRLSALDSPAPHDLSFLPPGTEVGDYTTVTGPRGKVAYKYKAGVERGGQKVGGQFVPPEELGRSPEVRQANADWYSQQADRLQKTPGAEAAQAKIEQTSPTEPATLPPKLQPNAQQMEMLGSYYFDTAKRLRNSMSPEQIQSQIRSLQSLLYTDLPENEAITVGGRIRALEEAAKTGPGASPGLLPFTQEVEAMNAVRTMKGPQGTEAVKAYAAREEARGRGAYAQRVLAHLESGKPEAAHEEVSARLGKVEKQLNRGLAQGSKGVVNGEPVELLENPRYGIAAAKSLTHPEAGVQHVDVGTMTPIPTAGTTVRTKDGIVKVLGVTPEKGLASVEGKPGETREIPLSDLVEVAENPAQARQINLENDDLHKRALNIAGIQENPPVPATTAQGEPVTITGTSEDAATVLKAGGQQEVIPRNELRRSTKTKPSTAERKIVDLAPGTLPDMLPEKHRILYFVVPRNEAGDFESAYQRGQDLTRWVKGANVLPPLPASIGWKLYAVELPSRALPKKLYSERANLALSALTPEGGRVGTHESPVTVSPKTIGQGRVYRVPDELHAAAVQSDRDLQRMSKAEQVSYLRRLVNLNETIHSPVAEAATKARMAGSAAAEALGKGDAGAFVQAEQARGDALVQGAERLGKAEIDDLGAQAPTQPVYGQFTDQGLSKENLGLWEQHLNDLPSYPDKTLPGRSMVLSHSKVAGQRLYVAKHTVAAMIEGKPALREEFQVEPWTADNQLLREEIQSFPNAGTLSAYIDQQGYVPSATFLDTPSYVSKDNPSLSAFIRPNRKLGKVTAAIEEKVTGLEVRRRPQTFRVNVGTKEKPVIQEYETGKVEELSQRAQKYMAQFGSQSEDVASGMTYFDTTASQEFNTMEEAHAWVKSQPGNFRGITNKEVDLTPQVRFSKLPNVPSIAGQRSELWDLEPEVQSILEETIAYERRIPPAMREYAQQFAGAYEDAVGGAAFDPYLRKQLYLPTADDIGPHAARAVFMEDQAMMKRAGISIDAPRSQTTVKTGVPGTGEPQVVSVRRPRTMIEVSKEPVEGQKPGVLPTEQVPVQGGTFKKTILPGEEVPGGGVRSMEVGSSQPMIVPEDYQKGGLSFYNTLSEYPREPPAQVLRQAQVIEKILSSQTEKTVSFTASSADLADVYPSPAGILRDKLARYSPTGQIVEITQENLTGKSTRIRFPEDGAEMEVSDDLLTRSHTVNDLHDYRLANAIVDGRYADYFKRPAPLGYGDWERQLGLFGSNDRYILREAFSNRALEAAQHLRVLKNGSVSADQGSLDELMSLYLRSQDLDLVAQVPRESAEAEIVAPKGKRAFKYQDSVSESVLDGIRAVDPKLVEPFKYAAYQAARKAYGDTPLGDLAAKANAGLLSSKQEGVLREWAQDAGDVALSRMSPSRIVTELIQRKLIDPTAFKVADAFQKEAGFIKFFRDTGIPHGDVEISFPQIEDISWFQNYLGVPWKTMYRHPVFRLLWDQIHAAQNVEVQGNRAVRELIQELQASGATNEDFLAARKLLQTHETWEQAAKAGAPEKLQFTFEKLRGFLDENRLEAVRHLLRRRIEPLELDLGKGKPDAELTDLQRAHRQYLASIGKSPDEVIDGFSTLIRNPDAWHKYPLNTKGEIPSGWTHDEIETFVNTMEQRPYGPEVEEWQRMGVRPEIAKEMTRQFPFWKRYGIKNYWPLIHEGNIAITVERGGQEVLAGWAPTLPDAYAALHHLIDKGKINVSENIRFAEHTPRADELLVQATASGKEFRTLQRELAKTVSVEPDAVRSLFLASDPQASDYVRRPSFVHAEERVANLEPPMPDPLKELKILAGRTRRMDYRWKVMEAFRTFQDPDLQRSMADAHGVPMVDKMPQAKQYAYNFVSRALGERTQVEEMQDHLVAVADWIGKAPALAIQQIVNGEQQIPLGELLNPIKGPRYFQRPYAARRFASDIIALQSQWRLGGSIGSAVANASQFWVNTIPKLVDDKVNLAQATQLGTMAWKDGAKIWLAQQRGKPESLSPDLKRLVQKLDAAGVRLMPAKSEAGASSSWALQTEAPTKLGKGTLEFAHEWTMHKLMLGFNGAEATNRFGTAIAAIRKGEALGMSEAAQVESARDLVRETQFIYDELAMPRLLAAGGPMSRVMFQFKPFLINQLSFEKDLVMNAILKHDPAAIQQLTGHMGALALFGGAVGLAHNPVMSAVGGAARLVKADRIADLLLHPEESARKRRLATATPEQIFSNSMHYQASDLLYYGVPGLLHMAEGQRVGVAGQDITMNFDLPGVFGPTFSIYGDLAKTFRAYAQQRASGAALAGAVAGALAPSFIYGRGGKLLSEVTMFPRAVGSLVGASLFSKWGANPFADFLESSDEGRAMAARSMPTMYRNMQRSWQLAMQDGTIRDIDGKPQHIPVQDRTQEALYALTGTPTIRREEYTAAASLLKGDAGEFSATQRTYVERIARALVPPDGGRADMPKVYELLGQANELGLDVSDSALQQEMNALTQEAMDTQRKHLPLSTRYGRP